MISIGRTPLLALCFLLPLAPSCVQAQPEVQVPGRASKKQRNIEPPNANADAEDQGLADMEEMEDEDAPNAGEGFPIEAPQEIAIPATNYAPPANAIFVAPEAKDNGAGTQAAPTTLQNALKIAPVGGTIVLRGGTYRVGDLILPRRLTLQAFPGEQPWINGSVVVSDWKKDGELWRHDGWTARFEPEGRVAPSIDPNYPMAVYGDQAFLDGRALFQVGSRDKVKPGRFFVDWDKHALYIGDDPAGKTIEGTVHESGFNIVKRANIDAAGSIVRGIGVTHCGRQGIAIAAPRVTLENCAFVWNANRGLYFNPTLGEAPTDCVLRGSKLIANGQTGLNAARATNLLIENNEVSYNNVEGFRQGWSAGGMKFRGFDGLVVRDNVVEYNNATAIWLDVDANKATVVRNQANFNQGAGIMFEISDQVIIAFNVCQNNRIGVNLLNSHNARVYNNTLVNNTRNVRVNQLARTNRVRTGAPDGKSVAGTPPGAMFTTRGHIVKNNILWNSRPDTKFPLFDVSILPQQPQEARRSSLMVVGLSHNAYHRAGPNPALQAWSKDGGEVESFGTLEAFTAASGKGQNSLVTTGADPYFVDAANADFHLKPTSPALGKAEPLPADIAQAAGVPQNIGYIGALPPA